MPTNPATLAKHREKGIVLENRELYPMSLKRRGAGDVRNAKTRHAVRRKLVTKPPTKQAKIRTKANECRNTVNQQK